MKGWLPTPSQGGELPADRTGMGRNSAAYGGGVAWGWMRSTPGWHWSVVGMKVEAEAGKASECLKMETESMKQTENTVHLPWALS